MDDCHTFLLESADGTPLNACLWDATGPRATLALVHGFGEHAKRYAHFAQHFADNGVQVIAADLRGHGRSGGKRGVVESYDDFRADLAGLLTRARQIHEKGPLILFGHSMGGGVVLDHGLSGTADVDAIIASAPLVKPAEPVPGLLLKAGRMIAKLSPGATMKNAIEGHQISTIPDEQARYALDPLNHNRLGFRMASEMLNVGEAIAARADQWPASLPLLILHARGDQLTDFTASEAVAKRIGSAQFRALEGVEHEMHNDTSRALVYRTILDFIGTLS